MGIQEAWVTEQIEKITPPSEQARAEAKARWMACAHPLGSLGLLETVMEDVAALTGSAKLDIEKKAVLVFCADHGVVAQGVSQSESSVTTAIVHGLAAGRTAVCKMAERAGCRVIPVDLGVRDLPPMEGVLSRRVGNGTGDFTLGPAMTREQAALAIRYGMELVEKLENQGVALLATGEAGIGNTTASTAMACVWTGLPPEKLTGRGAGLSDEGLRRKIRAIQKALEVNRPEANDPLDVLAKVGGFDIAAMCGAFLGGALYGLPVLVDGFISSVAALCALRLCPAAEKAVFASHVSAEPAGRLLLDLLGKKPLLSAGMRLGEGTGAVAVMPLWDMAVAVYRDSYTFSECGIEAYVPLGEET